MDFMSQADLAAQLAGDTDEYRMELEVEQVAPAFRVPSGAFLVVRAGAEAAVRAAVAAMSGALQGVLGVRGVGELQRREPVWYARLPDRVLVEVEQVADRSYAGYGNLYRAIGAIAPWLEDARFFISEDYATWIDEYRIAAGELTVIRGFAEDEFVDAKRAYHVARAHEDDELRRFAAWLLAVDAGHDIPDRAVDVNETKLAAVSATIAIAVELDPDNPDVLFVQGRRARALGDHAAAARWFERAEATGDAKLALLRTTMAATAMAAGDTALARALLGRAADDRCAWILRGHLAGPAGLAHATLAALSTAAIGDREAIPWTGAGGAILDEHAGAVAALVADGTVTAPVAARAVLEWAELYRTVALPGLDPAVSRAVADALLTRAAALDPLDGDVAMRRVSFGHGRQGASAVKELRAVLTAFPNHAEALFWTAFGLRKTGEWEEALALWRRYDAVSAPRSSYERGTARSALVDCLTQVAYQHMQRGDYGAGVEALLDEALGLEDRAWGGALIGKGDLYEYRRDHAAALAYYDRAVARDRSSAHAWSGRASCLNNLGRAAEALACLDQAAALDAQLWHVPYVRACALANSGGDPAEIRALVERTIALDPARRAQILAEPDLHAFRDQLRDL